MVDKSEEKIEDKKPTKAELAEAERKDIKVEVSQKEEEKSEEKEDEKVEDKTEEKEEEKSEEKTEDEIEDKEEEIEKSEKTEDELKAEQIEAKTKSEKDRIQRRIDREVAKRKALETENIELKKQLAAKPEGDKGLTEEEVEKRSNQKALELSLQKEFVATCNKLADDATKLDKDFKKKIDAIAEDVGQIPGQMIGILGDLDNGGAILHHFTSEEGIDDYERIIILPPAKMALELGKISNKLLEAKKPKPKEISKVPAPVDGVSGQSRTGNMDLSKAKDMDEFNRIREAQIADRKKRQQAGMRP